MTEKHFLKYELKKVGSLYPQFEAITLIGRSVSTKNFFACSIRMFIKYEIGDIPYELVAEPAKCPLFGIKYCAEKEIESIYKDGE